MKLYMVFVGDRLDATYSTERSARDCAKRLTYSYVPAIRIVEASYVHTRTIKTIPARPDEDR